MNPRRGNENAVPDSTAVRVALWRALHVEIDPPPHVLDDRLGIKLVAPDAGWRTRPDMDPQFTQRFRASIVARARFIEDLVAQESSRGVTQYVILGAGLDTFSQRRPEIASRLRIFEVDRPDTQAWKRQRIIKLGLPCSDSLRFVPVDFESGNSWWESLIAAGFDTTKPAIVASSGVTLYLTKAAITSTLRQFTVLAPGSTLVMTFILPPELAEPDELPGYEAAERGARKSGTPFISYFAPDEMLALAREAGLPNASVISAADLTQRYFASRTDGLRPGSESLLVAKT
jgi:methyltransferase (TIGR00027 family)